MRPLFVIQRRAERASLKIKSYALTHSRQRGAVFSWIVLAGGFQQKDAFVEKYAGGCFYVKADSSLARKTRKRQCLRMCVRW